MTDAERLADIRRIIEDNPSLGRSAEAFLLHQLDAANADLAWARATPRERRARIAEELIADPHVSTRRLAARLHASRDLVAEVRAELIATGTIADVGRLGGDGKTYHAKTKAEPEAAEVVPALTHARRTAADVEAWVREARRAKARAANRVQ